MLKTRNQSVSLKHVATAAIKGAIGGAVPFFVAFCLFSQVRSAWPSYLGEFIAIGASCAALLEYYGMIPKK
jgi:hypothetical protein